MITVKVRKEEILEALVKHQERYQTTRAQLVEAYKKKATEYQVEFAEYVQKQAEDLLTEDDLEPTSPHLPEDKNGTYSDYIAMITSHMDSSIDLNHKSYSRLVLDKWDWIASHISTLSSYSLSTSTMLYASTVDTEVT